jgi:thioredoxin-related protein
MGKKTNTTKKDTSNSIVNTSKGTKIIDIIVIISILMVVIFFIYSIFNNKEKNYENIESFPYSEYKKEIQKGPYTIVVLTKTGCHYCAEYKPIVDKALRQFGMSALDLNISLLNAKEVKELHDNVESIKDWYDANGKEQIPTPTTIIYQNGQEIDSVVGLQEYDEFISFLIKNGVVDNENL